MVGEPVATWLDMYVEEDTNRDVDHSLNTWLLPYQKGWECVQLRVRVKCKQGGLGANPGPTTYKVFGPGPS